MELARTLDEAISALALDPIEPGSPWYVAPTISVASGKKLPPLARLRAQLLRSEETDRFFLSGHIGSGKTTELRRLLADPEIRRRFYVVAFDVAPTDRPSLSSHELLFLVAAELYRRASTDDALTCFEKKDRWLGILKRMDAALYGPTGLHVQGGKFGVVFDLFFLKLSQDISVDDVRRKEFRRFAETQGSALVDLIDALVADLASALVHAGLPHRVLVAIDDLEKLQRQDQFHEIFETNLGALLAPRVPLLVTVPPSLTFGAPGTGLGQRVTHLRPIQVLTKTAAADPAAAADAAGIATLRSILAARLVPGLFTPQVVSDAALYSGGVIREFVRLLRLSAIQALDLYGQKKVTNVAFEDVLVEERNGLARTLYPTDKEALRAIHETHALKDPTELDYMRRSVVFEYNHEGIWWEAAPMLWEWLSKA